MSAWIPYGGAIHASQQFRERSKVSAVNATNTGIRRYLWSAVLIALALVSFYGMIWVIWDL